MCSCVSCLKYVKFLPEYKSRIKNNNIFILIWMSVGWDVKWCPMSRINNPLGTQKTVSLDFDED